MKALVVGASGFLGSYAGFALDAAGWAVTGVSRKPLEFYPSVAPIEELDDVSSLIRASKWDVIINCVALANATVVSCASPKSRRLATPRAFGNWSRGHW